MRAAAADTPGRLAQRLRASPLNAWALLSIAITAEVLGTTALKASKGFTRFWPAVAGVLVLNIWSGSGSH